MSEYSLAFPINIDKIKDVSNILKSIYMQISNNTNENINLTQLRDTLLPKLMSGEIDVSNVEIYEVLTNKLSLVSTVFVWIGLEIKFLY